MPRRPKQKLGEVLKERRRISEKDLQEALQKQQSSATMLGEILMQSGSITKDDLTLALEEVSGFRYVDARLSTVEPAALNLLPKASAIRYCALPVVKEGRRQLVAVLAEPQNLKLISELQFATGMDISPRLGFRSEILEAIETFYGGEGTAQATDDSPAFLSNVDVSNMQFVTATASERNRAAIEEFEAELRNERTPAVRLCSALLAAAVARNASDIHIECQPFSTLVRIRVDGMLRELGHVPVSFTTQLISRIKILADMDIAERRVPQDGRFLVQIGNRPYDLRVSTLPTPEGEKVAIRILHSAFDLNFAELGISSKDAAELCDLLKTPQGMLLVTGPTGSGKTTTLHAALNEIRQPHLNVTSVEDPIEYKIEGVTQVQINPKAGLTFANCLRSLLRQDPNIILIGEIRDQETAEIALRAAQTGHLILSTLHTNDSLSAITRLLDLHVAPYLIASSVSGVVAQRLVRKLCACKERRLIPTRIVERLAATGLECPTEAYAPVGCELCEQTGYRGRIAVYELLVIGDELRSGMRAGFDHTAAREFARAAGMRTMHEDAMLKVSAGTTSIEEIMRAVPFDSAGTCCHRCRRSVVKTFSFCPNCGCTLNPAPHSENSGPLCATTTEGSRR